MWKWEKRRGSSQSLYQEAQVNIHCSGCKTQVTRSESKQFCQGKVCLKEFACIHCINMGLMTSSSLSCYAHFLCIKPAACCWETADAVQALFPSFWVIVTRLWVIVVQILSVHGVHLIVLGVIPSFFMIFLWERIANSWISFLYDEKHWIILYLTLHEHFTLSLNFISSDQQKRTKSAGPRYKFGYTHGGQGKVALYIITCCMTVYMLWLFGLVQISSNSHASNCCHSSTHVQSFY